MTELFQRKALYNLIQLQLIHEKTKEMELEPWQVANYREYPTETLLEKFTLFDLPSDLKSFEELAKDVDTPEELVEILGLHLNPQENDRVYLLTFELWRRLFPEKQSLSIFCDELDFQIQAYARGQLHSFEAFQDLIANFQAILDKNLDEGGKPEEVFAIIQTYTATDLESFLYEYITDQIEEKEIDYAHELLDGFYKYVSEKSWFDFLKARLEIVHEKEEGFAVIEKLLGAQKSFELHLEVLFFLSRDYPSLFKKMAPPTLKLIETEEEFQEFALLNALHFQKVGDTTRSASIDSLRNDPAPLDQKKTSLKGLLK